MTICDRAFEALLLLPRSTKNALNELLRNFQPPGTICPGLRPVIYINTSQYLEQIAIRLIASETVGIHGGCGNVRLGNIYTAFRFINQKKEKLSVLQNRQL